MQRRVELQNQSSIEKEGIIRGIILQRCAEVGLYHFLYVGSHRLPR